MKREIKFRGKRIDNGEWVYGSYTSMRENNRNNPFCQVEPKIFHRIWQWEAGDWNMGGYANYEVIPETIGQFTGIQDVTGDDIYEGDILEVPGNRYKDCRGVVKFIQGAYWLVFVNDDLLSIKEAEEYWDVISNIHDNP